jgi:formate dehydrogenase assembly factor FdhD
MNNPLPMAPQATRSTNGLISSTPPEYEKTLPTPFLITQPVIDNSQQQQRLSLNTQEQYEEITTQLKQTNSMPLRYSKVAVEWCTN